MADLLYSIDRWLFILINERLSNPVFDFIMPPLTDWNKTVVGWCIFGSLWLLLMVRGGKRGRIVGVLVILLVGMADQISSSFIKMLVMRPRPCQISDSLAAIPGIHMLVPCGSGYSFPSSHAVNNFALATFLSFYYFRWRWIFFVYAGLMALSRVCVGVHYPSDVLAGALFGMLFAYMLKIAWDFLSHWQPSLTISPQVEPSE